MDAFRTIEACLSASIPLLLEGPTGCGKTYHVMSLAKKQSKDLHIINVSGELTVDSIIGKQTLVDGTVQWCDGVLTTAMRTGSWVLFDEFNTALPEVLTVINGVLDDSRSVTLPNDKNERVTAHADFRFIGTQNPASGRYAGTARLNDALLNRMQKVELSYMEPAREIEALREHTTVADSTLHLLVDIANFTRFNAFEDQLSTRDLVKIVRLRDKGKLAIRDAISTVLMAKYTPDEYKRLYDRFDGKLREMQQLTGYKDIDPVEDIKKQYQELYEAQNEFKKQKEDIRSTVMQEIVHEMLLNIGNSNKKTAEAK